MAAQRQETRSHNVVDGNYVTNRKGIAICAEYNAGKCTEIAPGSLMVCAADQSKMHQCSKCLKPGHTAVACKDLGPKSKGQGKSKKY
eukprot:1554676-Amphidinium_carterae.1